MTEDELFDLLTWIEEKVPIRDKALRFEAEADAIAAGEHGRASLLVAAGEHHQMRRAYAEARRCFEEALADGGDVAGHIVADLFSLAWRRAMTARRIVDSPNCATRSSRMGSARPAVTTWVRPWSSTAATAKRCAGTRSP